MCEDPQHWLGSIGEETERWSGILVEMGTGTPLLYAYPRKDIREQGGECTLDCVYNPTAPVWLLLLLLLYYISLHLLGPKAMKRYIQYLTRAHWSVRESVLYGPYRLLTHPCPAAYRSIASSPLL